MREPFLVFRNYKTYIICIWWHTSTVRKHIKMTVVLRLVPQVFTLHSRVVPIGGDRAILMALSHPSGLWGLYQYLQTIILLTHMNLQITLQRREFIFRFRESANAHRVPLLCYVKLCFFFFFEQNFPISVQQDLSSVFLIKA